MESGKQDSNDMGPHTAIIQVQWQVHEKKPDGSYYGATKAKGQNIFTINGDNLTLTTEHVNALIDLIRGTSRNVSELKLNEERLRQARLPGPSGPRENHINMFSMRGNVGGNSVGGPGPTNDIQV